MTPRELAEALSKREGWSVKGESGGFAFAVSHGRFITETDKH